jgi:hypothetical protein
MAVSSPPILKILSDLDIDLMDINNDVDYLRALMEATNALTITNASDKRIPVLQEEIRRVRADRKKADPKFKQKVKKTTVSPQKIMGKKMLPPATAKLDPKKLASKGGDGGGNALADILVSVTSIRDILINQIKGKRDDAKKKRRAAENAKRDKKESGLETVKKGFGALKTGVEKVVAPVKGLFGQVFDFLGKIIFGRVIFKLLEWFQNPDNKGKVEAIGKFLKKTWPVLLAAFLLFGTSFGRMAVKLGVMITRFSIKLVTKIIPALVKAIAKMKIGSFLKKIPGFNKGGEVPGSGNTDTVPAMLTPGEFVMSKGAVQQYGVDTLEGMNAAAGGTNTPTPMSMNQQIMQQTDETGTFGEDGFSMSIYQATPEQRHASYAEMGIPSMELWDGSVVPNFGKMGKDEMLEGIAITRENLVNDGAPQEVLDRLDSLETMQVNGMAGPDFIQNTINRLVPGSQEQVLGDLGDSISANARMGYAGGGLVKGNSGGGLQLIGPSKGYGEAKGGSKKFSGAQLKNLLNEQKGIGKSTVKPMVTPALKPTVKPMEVQKSINKPNVTSIKTPVKKSSVVVYNEQAQAAGGGGSGYGSGSKSGGNNEIPNINAATKRSVHKVKTLGISV